MTNEETNEIISKEIMDFTVYFLKEFGRMPKHYEFDDYYYDKTEGRIKKKEPVVHSRKEKLRRDYEDKFGNPPGVPWGRWGIADTEEYYTAIEKSIETGIRLEENTEIFERCPPNCIF